jgi:protein-L-isoaspartate(D-aspartate) O-methyltransferase
MPACKAFGAVNLRRAGVANVTLLEGDSARAPLAESAFDVIVIGGSLPLLPQAFLAASRSAGVSSRCWATRP